MNTVGKSLVLLQLALSAVLLTWAVANFLNPIDWGKREAAKAWFDPPDGKKEPVNERVAAHIDERIVAYNKFVEGKKLALARYAQAQKRFQGYEGKFADNHQEYIGILERLDGVKMDGQTKAPPVKDTDFREVKYAPDGSVALEPPLPWGRPLREKVVPGKKSYAEYLGELEAKMKEIHAVILKIEDLVEKKKVMTIRLNGLYDENGKLLRPGLYHLIEGEALAQQKLTDELAYLQPLWVQTLFDAQLFRDRRVELEIRLKQLGEQPPTIVP
jgi:hypothetical protein